MNQKEINELRRRFRPDKSAISRVYGLSLIHIFSS